MSELTQIKEELKIMDTVLTALAAQISQIHSAGDVAAEITAQVNGATGAAVAAAVAPFQQQITDLETSLTNVVTQLNNPNPTAESNAAAAATATDAVAASQAATATNNAAVGTVAS